LLISRYFSWRLEGDHPGLAPLPQGKTSTIWSKAPSSTTFAERTVPEDSATVFAGTPQVTDVSSCLTRFDRS
jgi:hypothetical protein